MTCCCCCCYNTGTASTSTATQTTCSGTDIQNVPVTVFSTTIPVGVGVVVVAIPVVIVESHHHVLQHYHSILRRRLGCQRRYWKKLTKQQRKDSTAKYLEIPSWTMIHFDSHADLSCPNKDIPAIACYQPTNDYPFVHGGGNCANKHQHQQQEQEQKYQDDEEVDVLPKQSLTLTTESTSENGNDNNKDEIDTASDIESESSTTNMMNLYEMFDTSTTGISEWITPLVLAANLTSVKWIRRNRQQQQQRIQLDQPYQLCQEHDGNNTQQQVSIRQILPVVRDILPGSYRYNIGVYDPHPVVPEVVSVSNSIDRCNGTDTSSNDNNVYIGTTVQSISSFLDLSPQAIVSVNIDVDLNNTNAFYSPSLSLFDYYNDDESILLISNVDNNNDIATTTITNTNTNPTEPKQRTLYLQQPLDLQVIEINDVGTATSNNRTSSVVPAVSSSSSSSSSTTAAVVSSGEMNPFISSIRCCCCNCNSTTSYSIDVCLDYFICWNPYLIDFDRICATNYRIALLNVIALSDLYLLDTNTITNTTTPTESLSTKDSNIAVKTIWQRRMNRSAELDTFHKLLVQYLQEVVVTRTEPIDYMKFGQDLVQQQQSEIPMQNKGNSIELLLLDTFYTMATARRDKCTGQDHQRTQKPNDFINNHRNKTSHGHSQSIAEIDTMMMDMDNSINNTTDDIWNSISDPLLALHTLAHELRQRIAIDDNDDTTIGETIIQLTIDALPNISSMPHDDDSDIFLRAFSSSSYNAYADAAVTNRATTDFSQTAPQRLDSVSDICTFNQEFEALVLNPTSDEQLQEDNYMDRYADGNTSKNQNDDETSLLLLKEVLDQRLDAFAKALVSYCPPKDTTSEGTITSHKQLPFIISIARSCTDGFTPPCVVEYIQDCVLDILHNHFFPLRGDSNSNMAKNKVMETRINDNQTEPTTIPVSGMTRTANSATAFFNDNRNTNVVSSSHTKQLSGTETICPNLNNRNTLPHFKVVYDYGTNR